MRRSKRIKIKSHKRRLPLVIVFMFFLTFSFLAFVFFKVITIDKFIYVNKGSDGSAEIIIIDPAGENLLKYIIPSNTELKSARGYGNYKVSSLWSISEKDKVGNLLPETIIKNYSLPVFLWKDGVNSNLNFYQKIKILLSKRTNIETTQINLNSLPNSILVKFVYPELTEFTPKIDVEDLTDTQSTLEKVSNIIEVIGGKITTNSKGYDANLDCEIYAKDQKLTYIFARIFNCEQKTDDKNLTTDIKIRLGAKFADRF